MKAVLRNLLQTKQGVHLLGLIIGVLLAAAVLTAGGLSERKKAMAYAGWEPHLCKRGEAVNTPTCMTHAYRDQMLDQFFPPTTHRRDAGIVFLVGWLGTVATLWMVLGLQGRWPK